MKTCGTGVSLRSRKCLTGANCRGTGTETKKCKIQDCPCKPLIQFKNTSGALTLNSITTKVV